MPESQKNPLAMALFSAYLLLYGGFIAINLFSPQLMERTPFAGVNLAIWYGFGLILSAILLAFIYGIIGSKKEERSGDASDDQEVSK